MSEVSIDNDAQTTQNGDGQEVQLRRKGLSERPDGILHLGGSGFGGNSRLGACDKGKCTHR